jgi:hypothetical protein
VPHEFALHTQAALVHDAGLVHYDRILQATAETKPRLPKRFDFGHQAKRTRGGNFRREDRCVYDVLFEAFVPDRRLWKINFVVNPKRRCGPNETSPAPKSHSRIGAALPSKAGTSGPSIRMRA